MTHITTAADIPLKAQTRMVRWMLQMIQASTKAGKSEMTAGMFGRIVTFHGRAGEAQLKNIILGKDVALYRWKRGLDLGLRTGLAQIGASQKCGVLTSDASVIAALDAANIGADEEALPFGVTIGVLSEAEQGRVRERERP
jgi:hypothetical protein